MYSKFACLLLICLRGPGAAAQNLVINGSFIDANTCTEYQSPCSPSAWFFVQKVYTRGYISNVAGVNGPGQSRALTLMVAARQTKNRDYWETMLLQPMEPGEKYAVSLKLASGLIGPNLNDIGFFFADSLLASWTDTLLQPAGYIGFLDAKAKQLKEGWFEINKTFTATGRHRFLVIGNFSPKPNMAILDGRGIHNAWLTLSVTDIVLSPVRHKDYPGNTALKDSLYAIHTRHYILPQKDSTLPPPPPVVVKPKVDTLQINNIRFAFNSYTLANPDTLELLRPYLSQGDVQKIIVTGYTDDAGTEAYNQSLSFKRAQEVARLLSKRFTIATALVTVEGKGISTRYLQKEMNRRVEIYIYHNSR